MPFEGDHRERKYAGAQGDSRGRPRFWLDARERRSSEGETERAPSLAGLSPAAPVGKVRVSGSYPSALTSLSENHWSFSLFARSAGSARRRRVPGPASCEVTAPALFAGYQQDPAAPLPQAAAHGSGGQPRAVGPHDLGAREPDGRNGPGRVILHVRKALLFKLRRSAGGPTDELFAAPHVPADASCRPSRCVGVGQRCGPFPGG